MSYTVDQIRSAKADAMKAGDQAAVAELDKMLQVQMKRQGRHQMANQVANDRRDGMSPIKSAMRGATQSATFNLVDEIAAGLMAIPGAFETGDSIPEAYRGIRDAYRNIDDVAESENPNSYLVGEVGGAFVPGTAAVKGAKQLSKIPGEVMSRLRPAGQLAVAGATGGGVAGYGASEEEDLGEQLEDAGIGATLGAVAAPVLGYAGGKVADWGIGAWNQLSRKFAADPDEIGRIIAREAAEADGYHSVDDVEAALVGDGHDMLADLGPNLQQTGAIAAKTPGAGRTTAQNNLNERSSGQAERIEDAIVDGVQPKWTDYKQFIRDVSAERRTQSEKMYTQAYNTKFEPSERLLELQNNRYIQEAIPEAERRLAGKLSEEKFPGEEGNYLALADQVKRVLDDAYFKNMKDAPELARDILKVKKAWVAELDALVPSYANARGIWAGGSEMLNAAEYGREVLRGTKSFDIDVAEVLEDFGEGQMDAFRIGIVRGMIDKLELSGEMADAGKRLMNNTRTEKIIGMAYPDGQADMLKELIDAETNRQATRNAALGGSQTYQNMAAADRLADERSMDFGSMAMDIARRIINENIDPRNIDAQDLEKVSDLLFGKITNEELRKIFATAARGRTDGLPTGAEVTQGAANLLSGQSPEVPIFD